MRVAANKRPEPLNKRDRNFRKGAAMADEYNPQGVDQTPQYNENPAPNGNDT